MSAPPAFPRALSAPCADGAHISCLGYVDGALSCECGCHEKCGETAIPAPTTAAALLAEAASLISGPRRSSYGPVEESFRRTAAVWSAVLNHTVSPRQVALCMAGLKLCREAHEHAADNCVDGAAYFALADELGAGEPQAAQEATP